MAHQLVSLVVRSFVCTFLRSEYSLCISTFMKPLAQSFSASPVSCILFTWAIYLIPFICMVDVLSLWIFAACCLLVSFRLDSSHLIFFHRLTCQRNGVDDSHRCCMRCWQNFYLTKYSTHLHKMRYADEEIGWCVIEEHKNGPSYSFRNISVLVLMRFKVISTNRTHSQHIHIHTYSAHITVLLAQ